MKVETLKKLRISELGEYGVVRRRFKSITLTKRILLVVACLCGLSLIPTFADDEKTKADNTATNERDRSGETQTSGDQSNSSSDLKVTQAIRQALMKDDTLSTTAKNIKVITENGQVTLRGPVNNAQEKARVDQLAKSAAGGAHVVDQLDIKGSY